jgi:putative ATP-binding cassette transporter
VDDPSPRSLSDHLALFRRFAQIAKAFFIDHRGRETRFLVLALLVLCLVVGLVQVWVSYANRNFITSLAQRDSAGFYRNLWKYLAAFAVAVPVGVFYRYAAERLSLNWRQWFTHLLVQRFFFNRAYYRLRDSERVDNPDQRISEDVRSFTTGVLGYLLTFINSCVTLFAFMGVLFTITWKLPVLLVVYTGIGTLLSILIGQRLVGLHFRQYQREADFRYGLVRVRDNAESIAFFRGEKRESADLLRRFAEVVNNTFRIIGWNRTLGFFTHGYNSLAVVVPLLIVGPMFMQGAIEYGVVTQAEGAFAQVIMALSVIIAQFEGLSAFAAGIRRLGDLWDELDEYDIDDVTAEEETHVETTEGRRGLALNALTVTTPNGEHTLTRDLKFTLEPGRSVLIMGESGSGKSSLLRTIAGLWKTGSGSIDRPNINRLIFLPQRPYMVQGSLRAQLMYPATEEGADDTLLEAALDRVNLTEVLDRVDGDWSRVVDWTNVLSIGEQQRISFARIFLRNPVMAFLDEATSALDEPNEHLLYEHLRALGISYVSVGHRSTLKAHHDFLIVLRKDGTADISRIPKETPCTEDEAPID